MANILFKIIIKNFMLSDYVMNNFKIYNIMN